LDRCSIILSHLKGLAEYHEHSPIFNVPVASFEVILNIIRCMRLLAHHILLYGSEESRQFAIFSKWLRHEIDIQASDPASASAEETSQQDMGIDYSQLLAYIQGPMEKSKLNPFTSPPASGRSAISTQSSMYEDMKKSLDGFKRLENGETNLINIHSYFHVWQRQNRLLVDQITSHQRASSSMNCGIVLEQGKIAASDLRVVSEELGDVESKIAERSPDLITSYIALIHEKSPSQGMSPLFCCYNAHSLTLCSQHPPDCPLRYL
jgi:anaphase-promoting complex subunit 4